jgi:geranylgeranyl diphosphate synthase type 3
MVCPSTEQYLKMVDYSTLFRQCNVFTTLNNKVETGGLFRILVRLMTAKSKSPSPPDLTALASLLGRYFQIRDDYMNLNSSDVRDPTCVLSPNITH